MSGSAQMTAAERNRAHMESLGRALEEERGEKNPTRPETNMTRALAMGPGPQGNVIYEISQVRPDHRPRDEGMKKSAATSGNVEVQQAAIQTTEEAMAVIRGRPGHDYSALPKSNPVASSSGEANEHKGVPENDAPPEFVIRGRAGGADYSELRKATPVSNAQSSANERSKADMEMLERIHERESAENDLAVTRDAAKSNGR